MTVVIIVDNYRYDQFIRDMERLLSAGRQLPDADRTHDSPEFIRWREEVTRKIEDIRQVEYRVVCSITRRSFGLDPHAETTRKQARKIFDGDFKQVLKEIQLAIDTFYADGIPLKWTELDSQVPAVIPQKESVTGRTPWDMIADSGPKLIGLMILAILLMGGIAVAVHVVAEPGTEISVMGINYQKAK